MQTNDVILRYQHTLEQKDAEIAQLQRKLTEKAEEIKEFQRQLREQIFSEDRDMQIQARFGMRLSLSHARLLAFLLDRPAGVSREQIMFMLYGDREDVPDSKIVDVFVCKLRKTMAETGRFPEDAILTVRGSGFRINPEKREQIAEAAASPFYKNLREFIDGDS